MTAVPTDCAHLGGKGANLVRLAAAGLPVPPFVVLSTVEYWAFVTSTGLEAVIEDAVCAGPACASATIRAAFDAAEMPAAQRARLLADLGPLLDRDGRLVGPVAVRSSATTEDLPGQSSAGQQDTFLSVTSLDEVLARVKDCWASLWTERALSYRAHHRSGHEVALAVVVQVMVDAEASGVLFTANPRTGLRDETTIDAVAGLGDGLVSGRLVPDTFVVETATGAIREQTRTCPTTTLTPEQVGDLVALARRIVQVYDEPVDVEWARRGDEMFVLQARPITALYPLPAPNPEPHEVPEVWASFGAFQGMLEPITPLGQEMLRMMLAAAPRVIGRQVDWRTNRYVQPAGERLWVRVDSLLRIRATRRLAQTFLPVAEPSVAAIIDQLAEEPELAATRAWPSPRVMLGLTFLLVRFGHRLRAAPYHPEQARRLLDRVTEELVAATCTLAATASLAETPQARLSARVDAMETTAQRALPTLIPAFAPVMQPTLLMVHQLRELARKTDLPDADTLAMAVLRGLPGNVTTEMDLELSDVATTIQADATSWGWLAATPAPELTRRFLDGNLPTIAQRALQGFLDSYGMRGVAEIDLGRPRWRDDPTPLIATLTSYLSLPLDAQPRSVHKAGQQVAGESIRTLMDASTPGRALKIKRLAQAIRALAGARETPKFTLIRCLGVLRDGLDASAAELVAAGRLDSVDDLAFLRMEELRRAFSSDWQDLVAERRSRFDAEARRRQVPRVLVEGGRTYYAGLSGTGGELGGSGVSPGVAEGTVRVVHDPGQAQLNPGDILVCRGTDPAWTPLFLTAGGLITEVGGLMTHGSVVAREYGIPAVVGVHEATSCLADGDRVRIDGTSGAIERL